MSAIINIKQTIIVAVILCITMVLSGCKQTTIAPEPTTYINQVAPLLDKLHGHKLGCHLAESILNDEFGHSSHLNKIHVYVNAPESTSMSAPLDFSWPISISFTVYNEAGQRLSMQSFGPTIEHIQNKNSLNYFIKHTTRTFGASLSH